jgi:hypothetical protein
MTKIQAEAVARQYVLAINVHYQAELEELQRLQAEAEARVQTWLDSKAYRKKHNERPFLASYRMLRDLGFDMLRRLRQQDQISTTEKTPR